MSENTKHKTKQKVLPMLEEGYHGDRQKLQVKLFLIFTEGWFSDTYSTATMLLANEGELEGQRKARKVKATSLRWLLLVTGRNCGKYCEENQ